MDLQLSVVKPPIDFAQLRLPEGSNFKRYISLPPTAVKFNIPALGSKSTVPSK